MKKISLILFLCIIAFSILRAEDKSVIKLIPVYEKTFQDSIVDVIFDTATVSITKAKEMGWKDDAFNEEERVKGKATISYPKVVLVSRGKKLGYYAPATKRSSNTVKEIRFYDRNGTLLNTMEIGKQGREWIHISPNSKYILMSKIPTEYRPNYSGGKLYDYNGNKVWENGGPTPIAVSDEGYTVGANLDWQVPPEPGGSFYIYNPSGKLIKTIANSDKNRSAPLFAKYTSDGEYAVLVFKGTTEPPTTITLIKKTGEIMWKKEFSEYRFSGRGEELDILRGVGISGIFDLITSSSAKKIEDWKTYAFFIDWQGNLKWTVPLEIRGNMIVNISEDREIAYVVSTEGYIWCIKIEQGEMVWRHKELWATSPSAKEWSWEVPLLNEMDIKRNTLYIIGKQGRDWYSSTLFVFNGKSGRLLKKVEYPQEKIFFAKCKRKIGLINTTKRKMYIFKKVQK